MPPPLSQKKNRHHIFSKEKSDYTRNITEQHISKKEGTRNQMKTYENKKSKRHKKTKVKEQKINQNKTHFQKLGTNISKTEKRKNQKPKIF